MPTVQLMKNLKTKVINASQQYKCKRNQESTTFRILQLGTDSEPIEEVAPVEVEENQSEKPEMNGVLEENDDSSASSFEELQHQFNLMNTNMNLDQSESYRKTFSN